eukprot:6683896-Heterocapsa_arctica.AAC.1
MASGGEDWQRDASSEAIFAFSDSGPPRDLSHLRVVSDSSSSRVSPPGSLLAIQESDADEESACPSSDEDGSAPSHDTVSLP